MAFPSQTADSITAQNDLKTGLTTITGAGMPGFTVPQNAGTVSCLKYAAAAALRNECLGK